MAVLHGTGTLAAAPQSLLAMLFSGVAAAIGGPNDVACNFLSLQPDGANANAAFVGATSTVSTTDYGVRLPASAGGVPSSPYVMGAWSDKGPVRLSEVYVVGTAGEKIHVLYVWW